MCNDADAGGLREALQNELNGKTCRDQDNILLDAFLVYAVQSTNNVQFVTDDSSVVVGIETLREIHCNEELVLGYGIKYWVSKIFPTDSPIQDKSILDQVAGCQVGRSRQFPNNSGTMNHLARLLVQCKRLDLAEQITQREISRYPCAINLNNHATILAGAQKYNEAASYVEQALVLDPNNVMMLASLAIFQMRATLCLGVEERDWQQPRSILAQAQTLAPNDINVLNTMAVLEEWSGNPAKAVELYTKAMENEGSDEEVQNARENLHRCCVKYDIREPAVKTISAITKHGKLKKEKKAIMLL